jgi:hypothetical protein
MKAESKAANIMTTTTAIAVAMPMTSSRTRGC